MVTDPARLIASVHHSGARLDLKNVDICFLIALHAKEDSEVSSSIDDDTMVDLFAQVCELVEPGAENVRTRATHAIQRLRDQRLLARIDGAGLVRAGDFNLTTLATSIVEFFAHDASDVLTRESLGLLTKELIAKLSEIKTEAGDIVSTEKWRESVIAPLQITIKDLVNGIERRQRGLDREKQDMRTRISELLEMDWFASIEQCERLLEDTASTLSELKTVLLEDSHQMRAYLQDIEQIAHEARQSEAEEVARRVMEHIDRVAAWGSARQQSWSEYYQYVHGFLRDVVRLDPGRALSERLIAQLSGWVDERFCLLVAETKPMRVLRDVEVPIERPAVERPRMERERGLANVSTDSETRDLESLVSKVLASSPNTLSSVVQGVLPELDTEQRYGAIGEIAALVARHTTTDAATERPWVSVPGGVEIEDWSLHRSEPA